MSHKNFVIQNEVDKFSSIASNWWQTNGETKALQALNKLRADFISQNITQHFNVNVKQSTKPKSNHKHNSNHNGNQCSKNCTKIKQRNIKIIDVGCGGGLLTEAMFNKGFTNITGIDVSLECINAAKAHAKNAAHQAQQAKQSTNSTHNTTQHTTPCSNAMQQNHKATPHNTQTNSPKTPNTTQHTSASVTTTPNNEHNKHNNNIHHTQTNNTTQHNITPIYSTQGETQNTATNQQCSAKSGQVRSSEATQSESKQSQANSLTTENISYFHETINQAAAHASATQNKYDVVLCMEVIEHVNDFEGFLKQCSSLLKQNGLIFVATINKTIQSLMFAKIAAEYILSIVPKETHDWNKFVKPHQIVNALESPDSNCKIKQSTGVSYNPATNHAQLCNNLNINYMMMFEKR